MFIESVCEWCGVRIDTPARRPGPRPRFCSQVCRSRSWEKANPEKVEAKRRRNALKERESRASVRKATQKHCPQCQREFFPRKSLNQRYCSIVCTRRAAATDNPELRCCFEDCERGVRYKEAHLCAYHYKLDHRARFGREATKPQPWTDARRDSYHRRRALKVAAATGDRVVRDEIAERDDFACHICTEFVDMSLEWPHPLSPSLDHVVPLSKGGPHSPENVRLSHLKCNVAKGAKVERAT